MAYEGTYQDTDLNKLLMDIQYARLTNNLYDETPPDPEPEPTPTPAPPEPTPTPVLPPNIYYVALNRYPYAYDMNNIPTVLKETKDVDLINHDIVVVPWVRTNIAGVTARVCEDIGEAYEYMSYEEDGETVIEWNLIWSDKIYHPEWNITLIPDPEEEE